MMSYAWHDFVGNLGVLCILGAYLGLQLGRLNADGSFFSVINGLGASLILVSLMYNFNLSAAITEAAWLVISVVGLARSLLAGPKGLGDPLPNAAMRKERAR